MRILALDTATEACSVALWHDGDVLQQGSVPVRGHAELLLPMVRALLAEAGTSLRDLDAIAFGRGPGAFTGVRIAASVTQALAFGLDRPVVAVSDLAAVALRAHREHGARRVLVCMDARMREVYAGTFEVPDGSAPVALDAERVIAPQDVRLPGDGDWFGAGHGFVAHAGLAAGLALPADRVLSSLLPAAGDVARIAVEALRAGRARPAEEALPVYLRNDVASTARHSSR